MIHVRPANDGEIKMIFGENAPKGANAMIADDSATNETVGHSEFTITDGKFILLNVEPAEKDIWLCDLIARATMNYAVNRGILTCRLGENAPKNAFQLLRYIENESENEINIIHLFTMCKNCSKTDQNA